MKFLFRADASLDIGSGHVMRCLTLADALRARGAACSFLTRAHAGNLVETIRARGHAVQVLPPPRSGRAAAQPAGATEPAHAAWLGTDWETDALECLAVLADSDADTLVVDHYAIDARWERRLRAACRRLMVIDDLADRPHDCDLLLDQNAGRQGADYAALVPPACSVFAGPQHAVLRPEFATLRPATLAARRARSGVRQLMISMGGVDQGNATDRVLDALAACPLPAQSRLTVVMGPHAPWLAQIRARAASLPWPVEVRAGVPNLASLMAESDLAIGATGGTALERCCLGLPSLALVLAPNQRPGAEGLARAGAVWMLEDGPGLPAGLAEALAQLERAGKLQAMADAAAAVTDGLGAVRMAEVLTHEHA